MHVSIVSPTEEHLQTDVKNFLQEVHENCSDLHEIIHCDSEKRDSGFSSKDQGSTGRPKPTFRIIYENAFHIPVKPGTRQNAPFNR